MKKVCLEFVSKHINTKVISSLPLKILKRYTDNFKKQKPLIFFTFYFNEQ